MTVLENGGSSSNRYMMVLENGGSPSRITIVAAAGAQELC